MTTGHLVRRAEEVELTAPGGWAADATAYQRCAVVGEDAAVHTGFGICELGAGGEQPWHVHSFEESFHVVAGTAVLESAEGVWRLPPGSYGVVPVGTPHRLRNDGPAAVRWAEMQAPAPRSAHHDDTFVVPAPWQVAPPVQELDVRDPRTRHLGLVTPAHLDVGGQSQEMLAVSASMRTALLVYSGITVKMMVDSDLGARLSTMFMVQYDPDGVAGAHDHPFEEAYYFLEGHAEAVLDGVRYELGPGDVAWAGVGAVHSFRNLGDGPLRWLETQAPQPPPRHAYRFARDWDYLEETTR